MKTIRKIAVLILTLAILIQAVPVSAESSSFNDTHWYVSGISSDYTSLLDDDSRMFLGLLGSLVQMVPYSSWLEGCSFYAVYIGLDLKGNGTFDLTFLTSENGVIDWSTHESASGTWRYASNSLYLTGPDGESLRLGYRGGKLSLNLYGVIDLTLEQA